MARPKVIPAEKSLAAVVAPATPAPGAADAQAAQAAADAQAAAATPASTDAGTEGAAEVQQNTPQVSTAAPTAPTAQPEPANDERRAATVASRIEHDGEVYEEYDLIPLTEAQFDTLRRGGSVMDQAWDDCAPA